MPSLAEKGNALFKYRPMTAAETEKNKVTETLTFILDYFFSRYVGAVRGAAPMIPPSTLGERFKILAAGTGSGKSSSIAPELYLRYWEATHKNIAILQPTVATATSIPDEILTIPKYAQTFRMGQNIGYQTKDIIRKPISGIIFMTMGILTRMLQSTTDEQFMQKFSFILIDEAHARRVELDLCMYLLKHLVLRNVANSACPFVIAMSGTMPIEKYATYLNIGLDNVISVEARTFPREEHYLAADSRDYIADTVATILEIHTSTGADDKEERGDIIIFVKGPSASRDISKKIRAANEKLAKKILITKIDSHTVKVGADDFFSISRPLKSSVVIDKSGKRHVPTRRLIIGTPAIETGQTFESAKYCIDTGYMYSSQYDPVWSINLETQRPISQSMAEQRSGRVGRRFPGVYYRMYTKDAFDTMDKDQKPDIFSYNISSLMLSLIISSTMSPSWDKSFVNWMPPIASFSIQNIDLIDTPSVDSITNALEQLFVLGLISGTCQPTIMGCAVARLRTTIENARMIFEGYIIGANIEDLVTISAILDNDPTKLINTNPISGSVFAPMQIYPKSDRAKKHINVSCDVIELLFAYYMIRDYILSHSGGSAASLFGGSTASLSGGSTALLFGGSTASLSGSRLHDTSINLRDWMESHGLVYDQWLYVIGARDMLIMELVSIGLNPFQNSIGVARHKYKLPEILKNTPKVGLSEIRKLKACMLEGYRLTTATWDSHINSYIHDFTHLAVIAKSLTLGQLVSNNPLISARPRQVITFRISLKPPPKSGPGDESELYIFVTEIVSVIDNFVVVDETFPCS